MLFNQIINAKIKNETDRPQMRKDIFPISPRLEKYLQQYGREKKLSVSYRDLLNYRYSNPVINKSGKITHWETAVYDLKEMEIIKEGLVNTYAALKTEGNLNFVNHLDVERIDFCEFGNSMPFRIRIINRINDNYDHFYIKAADASRIYGLELEDLLTPNHITFLTHKNTLVEEHIPGIPGDIFLEDYLSLPESNKIRIAKEFVKFNERCFARLLGDMRSYNFVVDITPDIEDYQYRLRAIDFDQQSYEGKKNFYLPQFYRENYDFVDLVLKTLSPDVIAQYQVEEQTAMAYRAIAGRKQLFELLSITVKDEISEFHKIKMLREELNQHFDTKYFSKCSTMGTIVKRQLKLVLREHLQQIFPS
ncbi:MAG TPA: hypothetical protein PK987_09775 [Ferruginibacter sp.]|nr:hypothetical protein [Ferruginibacter sp.]